MLFTLSEGLALATHNLGVRRFGILERFQRFYKILQDSVRGEIGRFWPGRTRVYEDSGSCQPPDIKTNAKMNGFSVVKISIYLLFYQTQWFLDKKILLGRHNKKKKQLFGIIDKKTNLKKKTYKKLLFFCEKQYKKTRFQFRKLKYVVDQFILYKDKP